MSVDQRSQGRLNCSLRGTIQGSAARIRDLSESGARCSSDASVSIGQVVRISLSLPGRFFRLHLRARVVHTSGDSIGVAFISPSQRATRALQAALGALLAEHSTAGREAIPPR